MEMPALVDVDPVRATLLAILKQLNQAESSTTNELSDPALELQELEGRLRDFWAVGNGSVKVALAVGLLLRNRLIVARSDPGFSWQRGREVAQRYQITPEGKRFLLDSLESSDRIS
jgi:hypothetical protein